MLYLGLDVHSKWTTIKGFSPTTGQTVYLEQVANSADSFKVALGALDGPLYGAMESGTNCWSVYRILRPLFEEVIVVDPVAVWGRVIRRGAKTDKRDAMGLAVKLSRGELSGLYVPDEHTQDLRSLGRAKIQASRTVTKLSNELGSLLRSWGIVLSCSLLSKQGARLLEEAKEQLPEHSRRILEMWVHLLRDAQDTEAELEARIKEAASQDEVCQRLMTIPSVKEFTALVIRSEIGDIARFGSAKSLVNYCGLCPTVSQSADKKRSGRLSKSCNHVLRYVLVLRGQGGSRFTKDNPLSQTYWRTALRHSRNDGTIAVARQLARVIYAMLLNGYCWDPGRIRGRREAMGTRPVPT